MPQQDNDRSINLINIGPGDLRAFLGVARAQSFRRSALLLGISQPALTARIQRLEHAVGLRLFDRTSRRVALTEAGARLMQRAEHTIEELESIVQDLRNEADLKQGHVAFGASPSIAGMMLPPIIQKFMASHPGVRVSMADELGTPILERIALGKLEFGLIPTPAHANEFDVRPLFTDEMVIIAPKAMPIPANTAVRFQDLMDLPFVTMSRPSSIWRMLSEAFQVHGKVYKPVFEANSAGTLLGFVESGIGMTVLPSIMLEQHKLNLSFRVQVSDMNFRREVSFVTMRGRALSPAAAALAAMMKADLRQPPPARAR
ncbi:MAG: LysR family transcriptional regulator [Burkholderiaceae bacterium]|nr:LysR family transcriptional regulator [Burkholderiaceae bacterium]